MSTLTTSSEPRELVSRANDGLEVTLFWIQSTNRLVVSVSDTKTGDGSRSLPRPRTRSTSSTTPSPTLRGKGSSTPRRFASRIATKPLGPERSGSSSRG